jgi:mRNA interferase MazF
MNIIPGDDSMTFEREIHRGEIFYMTFKEQVGSEQQGGRPVIVVSNETCNKFSPTVTIVPLTTKDKKPLPTHVELNDERLPVYGTILCEQVQSVSHYRLGSYVGEVDDNIMRKIEKALCVQLDITTKNTETATVQAQPIVKEVVKEVVKVDNTAVEELKSELEQVKLALVKAQERECVFRELYEETIRGGNA